MAKRTAEVKRETKETDIQLKLNLDGSGNTRIKTGIGLLDHMLELFAFHGLFDLEIELKRGDLEVDIHHTNEDIGIVLGQAFKKALGDKRGIKRFGFASVPMEGILARVTLDISGRGFYNGGPLWFHEKEEYSKIDFDHFWESFTKQSGINLIIEDIKIPEPRPDIHTILEPIFKALGLALRQAVEIDPRRKDVPSTKGIID
ncbi:MAG TPA: imidazoleglycerol-phosphate dehydratase [bacterium]|nr:imidazoleglycerol-phosphate dehydratase [bacterium]